MKILIIDTDINERVLFSTALVENLKSLYTTASIDFAVQQKCEAVLNSNLDINKIIIIDKEGLNSDSSVKRVKTAFMLGMKIRRNKYDIIFTTSSADDTALACALSGVKTRVGVEPEGRMLKALRPYTDTYEQTYSKHIIEKKLDTMRVLGLKVSVKRPVLCASPQALRKVEAVLTQYQIGSFAHIHLGSSIDERCVDNELAAKLIDYLEREKNISTVVTALIGKAQSIRTLGILSMTKSRPLSLIGSLGLDEICALCAKSMLFIGVQSEVLHISSTQNIPSIAIFGNDSAYESGSWDGNLYESGYDDRLGKQSMGIHTVFQTASKSVDKGSGGVDVDETNIKMIISEIDSKLSKLTREE